MLNPDLCGDYFCQVRFLWRCARNFLRRLCLLIFAFRRFFNEPIILFLFLLPNELCRTLPQRIVLQLRIIATVRPGKSC